jgi:hypothetical protein
VRTAILQRWEQKFAIAMNITMMVKKNRYEYYNDGNKNRDRHEYYNDGNKNRDRHEYYNDGNKNRDRPQARSLGLHEQSLPPQAKYHLL